MSYKLLNGDCLELMKAIPDNSIDLIFTDLPYGQTSCKWDCPIDLEQMWIQYLRIKKTNTPIFFTTTTKFGVNLINSAPKKCFFRYDLVWVKSQSVGFLSSSRMPLRKHELIYVFYEKLPLYDLSSHKHKFIKERDTKQKNGQIYEGSKNKIITEGKYDPPLPTSVIKEYDTLYNNKGLKTPITKHGVVGQTTGQPRYDPPLPTSVIKETGTDIYDYRKGGTTHKEYLKDRGFKDCQRLYDPPLPTSILEIKSQKGKHSTQKPLDLMKYIFKYYSKEGDVILDNCMGSGSTGVAAIQMNRNFIGIELDKDIFKVAVDRLKNEN